MSSHYHKPATRGQQYGGNQYYDDVESTLPVVKSATINLQSMLTTPICVQAQRGKLNPKIPTTLSLPHNVLFQILYGTTPVSFPFYIRIQPLQVQRLLAHELAEVPIEFAELSRFPTDNDNYPNLANLFRQFQQYRQMHKMIHKPAFFKANAYKTFFQDYYRTFLTNPNYLRNNHLFFDTVIKRNAQNNGPTFLLTTHYFQQCGQQDTTRPQWLLITHIPHDVTQKNIQSIVAVLSGYLRIFMCPVDPATLTKFVFVCFKDSNARDHAVKHLNTILSTTSWGRENNSNEFTNSQTIKKVTDTSSDGGSTSGQKKKSDATKAVIAQQQAAQQQAQANKATKKYKIRAYPWISQNQYQIDYDRRHNYLDNQHNHAYIAAQQANGVLPVQPGNPNAPLLQHNQSQKSIHHRQPVIPVGIKQWTTGPIPYSVLLPRLSRDVEQALLIAQYFDYIHFINPYGTKGKNNEQMGGGIDYCLQQFEVHYQYLRTQSNTNNAGGGGGGAAGNGMQQGNTGNNDLTIESDRQPPLVSFNLYKFKFILKYLREVHFYDYFTTTLYPSLQLLQQDIGEEWYIMDPPEYTQQQYQHIATLLHNEHYISQQLMEEDPEPEYLPILNCFPVDVTLEPKQYFITAYYNAILAMTPQAFLLPHELNEALDKANRQANGNPQDDDKENEYSSDIDQIPDPPVPHNFWLLAHYYRTVYARDTPYSLQPTVDPKTQRSSADLYCPTNYISAINQYNQSLAQQQTTTARGQTVQHAKFPAEVVLPRRDSVFPTLTTHFWSNIDHISNGLKALFTPGELNRNTAPTVDIIDPDLYMYRENLLPNTTIPKELRLFNNTLVNSIYHHQSGQDQNEISSALQIAAGNVVNSSTSHELYTSLGIISIAQTINTVNYFNNLKDDHSDVAFFSRQLDDPSLVNKPMSIATGISAADFMLQQPNTTNSIEPQVVKTLAGNQLNLTQIIQSTPQNNPVQGLLEPVILKEYFTQLSPIIFQCKLCSKMLNSTQTILKHLVLQHNVYTTHRVLKQQQVQHLTTVPPMQLTNGQIVTPNILMSQASKLSSLDWKYHIDNALALSETLLYQVYYNDALSLHYTPSPLTNQQRLFLAAGKTFCQNGIIDPNNITGYRACRTKLLKLFQYEDNLSSKDIKLLDLIDDEWSKQIVVNNQVKEKHFPTTALQQTTTQNDTDNNTNTDSNKMSDAITTTTTKDDNNNNNNNNDDDNNPAYPPQLGMTQQELEDAGLFFQRQGEEFDHARMEKLRQQYKQKFRLTQLFKGIDGDNLGKGKDIESLLKQETIVWVDPSDETNQFVVSFKNDNEKQNNNKHPKKPSSLGHHHKHLELLIEGQQMMERGYPSKPVYYGNVAHVDTMGQYDPFKYM